MILLLLLLQAPSFGPPPEPPPPPPTAPCETNPGSFCSIFTMIIEGPFPRSFTDADFGRSVDSIDPNARCVGRLGKGSFRYFTTGTAPSSLVGILVPSLPEESDPNLDPQNTYDEGNSINLYDRTLITNFKAIWSNWAGAEINWECQL